MNLLQSEIKKLLGDSEFLTDIKFAGNSLVGRLSESTIARAEFITTGIRDHYDAIKLSVINRSGGAVDTLLLSFRDMISPTERGRPYIWYNSGEYKWYDGSPTKKDYNNIRDSLNNYLEMFSDPNFVHGQGQSLAMQFH